MQPQNTEPCCLCRFTSIHRMGHGTLCSTRKASRILPSNRGMLTRLLRIKLRPTLNFTVIVNPSSGPGSSSLPDENYYPAIKKLNSYDNVQTVGYVRTGYATRNITEVIDDVMTYAGWSSNSSDIAMSGIFFDEAVHEYDAAAVDYMRTIDEEVKNSTGLVGDRMVSLF